MSKRKQSKVHHKLEQYEHEHDCWDFEPALPHQPGKHGYPENDLHPGDVPLESICGGLDESQPVEQYDGTLGVSQGFVDRRQRPVGQLQWNANLASIYTTPGNVSGVRWCSGTLISRDLFLTAGHCFDANDGSDGWQRPLQSGSSAVIPPAEIATNMHVNFNYQVDAAGVLLAEEQFAVLELVEYRLGSLDFAIVRLAGDPGDTYGWTELAEADAVEGDMLCIIQHPAGLPKRIEAGPAFHLHDSRIGYDSIDTLGGSSGSGVLSSPGERIVGVHTNGGCSPAALSHNHGVRITSLFAASPILTALQGADAVENVGFLTKAVTIPAGTGRRSIEAAVTFDSAVLRAGVVLNGFALDFVDADHHVDVLEVDTDLLSIAGNEVAFRVECNYADKNSDDAYQGYVTALVIAALE